MCGIAGYLDFCRSPSRDVLAAMASALGHRGPDASGVWVEGLCGLAHARLSIIDLSGSAQPMAPADSRVALSYNGEIYNFADLRTQLQARGASLLTAGDTEALLRWVALEWEGCLSRLDGMFAFAAWHRDEHRLLLARDPLGKKPLFWCALEQGVVFASEVKAILEHPEMSAKLDLDSLREVLRFRAVYGHRSLYAGINQVPPGSWIEFSRGGARSGRYYSLFQEVSLARRGMARLFDADVVSEFGRHLGSAVRKRLVADVPVGAFLSGGLDSSLLVAEMRAALGDEPLLRTYSVGFAEDPASELPFAALAAKHHGTTHTAVLVGPTEYAEEVERLTGCRDAPLSEPADVAIGVMSGIAKRDVKVVLSGEAADEVFCGYPKYQFARIPKWGRRLVGTVGSSRMVRMAGWMGLDQRRAMVLSRALGQSAPLESMVQWFSYLERPELRDLFPGLDWGEEAFQRTMCRQREALDEGGSGGWGGSVGRMQAIDCLAWLPANLLERGDRMTMAAGLEMRLPFLDKAVVAFGLALPDRFKIRGGKGKWVVREWAKHRVPLPITRRKKAGFRVPLATWFRGPLREVLFDRLTSSRSLCTRFGNAARVRAILAQHDSGRGDRHLELWTLLATELWYQGVFCAQRERASGPSLSVTIPQVAALAQETAP